MAMQPSQEPITSDKGNAVQMKMASCNAQSYKTCRLSNLRMTLSFIKHKLKRYTKLHLLFYSDAVELDIL